MSVPIPRLIRSGIVAFAMFRPNVTPIASRVPMWSRIISGSWSLGIATTAVSVSSGRKATHAAMPVFSVKNTFPSV